VKYEFAGTVSFSDLPTSIAPGVPFSGSFIYNRTVDRLLQRPTSGVVPGATLCIMIDIDGQHWESSDGSILIGAEEYFSANNMSYVAPQMSVLQPVAGPTICGRRPDYLEILLGLRPSETSSEFGAPPSLGSARFVSGVAYLGFNYRHAASAAVQGKVQRIWDSVGKEM